MTDEEYIDYAEGLVEDYVEEYGPVHGYGIDTIFPDRYTDVARVEVVCGSDDDAEGIADYLDGQKGIAYVQVDGFVVSVEFNF